MRIVLDLLLLLPAFLYQSALAGHLQVRGVGADLICVMLATISLNQGWVTGAVGGLICGLLLDGAFGLTGYYALQYMAFGLAVGLAGERLPLRTLPGYGLVVFAACVLREAVPALYLFFADAQVAWGGAALKVLLCALLNAGLFLPLHLLIRRLHRWDVISAPVFHFHGKKW